MASWPGANRVIRAEISASFKPVSGAGHASASRRASSQTSHSRARRIRKGPSELSSPKMTSPCQSGVGVRCEDSRVSRPQSVRATWFASSSTEENSNRRSSSTSTPTSSLMVDTSTAACTETRPSAKSETVGSMCSQPSTESRRWRVRS